MYLHGLKCTCKKKAQSKPEKYTVSDMSTNDKLVHNDTHSNTWKGTVSYNTWKGQFLMKSFKS